MANAQPSEKLPRSVAAVRSIEAAALAGLAHAILSLASTYLLLRAPEITEDGFDVGWYADATNQRSIAVALNLMALGTVAFLWFVAVIRRRVGERENRFFGTIFLGSALLLAVTRMISGVLFATPVASAYLFELVPDSNSIGLWQTAGLTLAGVVGIRLESVFIISTTTIGRLSGALPRWLIWMGFLIGLVLMLVPLPRSLLIWPFPVWVILVSATMLIGHRSIEANTAG
jgi:MFS family permease